MKKYVHELREMVNNVIGDIETGLFQSKIDALNTITLNYNQFLDSLLVGDIMSILKCTKHEAMNYASTHCNMVSFWALLLVNNETGMLYDEFFSWCLANRHCNEAGYLYTEKVELCNHLNINFNPEFYREYKNVKDANEMEETFYQMRIQGHFMASYVKDGKVYLSDTSYRGQGIEAIGTIPPHEFKWLMKMRFA